MTLSPDPSAESLALASWYDSHPAIRRLWGVRNAEELRVIVAVETTHDNDDIYPAWFANTQAWASELHSCTGRSVRLELLHEIPFEGIEVNEGSVIIADVFWRDPTL